MRAERCSLLIAAAGDDEGCGGFIDEQLCQSSAERAIAAEDENLHPQGISTTSGDVACGLGQADAAISCAASRQAASMNASSASSIVCATERSFGCAASRPVRPVA
jgi:hypothetical protein